MAYTISIDFEQANRIVMAELKDTRQSFITDLASEDSNIFFWQEPEKDKAEIQRHIDALDLLIEWYHIPGE